MNVGCPCPLHSKNSVNFGLYFRKNRNKNSQNKFHFKNIYLVLELPSKFQCQTAVGTFPISMVNTNPESAEDVDVSGLYKYR